MSAATSWRSGPEPHDAILERCVDAAIFGDALTLDEERQMRALGMAPGEIVGDFERLAAELDLAELARTDSRGVPHRDDRGMPRAVEARLLALAQAWQPASVPHVATTIRHAPAQDREIGSTSRPRLDWLAAAACIALGAAATFIVLRTNAPSADSGTDPRTRDAAQFVRTHPKAVHWPWSATGDSHARGVVAGEAYFDPDSGEGLLVIEGLEPNDPTREQYQLWIFDDARDARYPVDGGVFDAREERLAVPVTARLPVAKPVMFAITVEKPGGAVVSDRRIALVAKP